MAVSELMLWSVNGRRSSWQMTSLSVGIRQCRLSLSFRRLSRFTGQSTAPRQSVAPTSWLACRRTLMLYLPEWFSYIPASLISHRIWITPNSCLLIMPRPLSGGIISSVLTYLHVWCLKSDDVWRLSRTSGLSREQRGLGRLKLAQR